MFLVRAIKGRGEGVGGRGGDDLHIAIGKAALLLVKIRR